MNVRVRKLRDRGDLRYLLAFIKMILDVYCLILLVTHTGQNIA